MLVVFEYIRKKKCRGTMIAIHKDLNPKIIEEYNDEFKLLVVEVDTEETPIIIMSGVGPQENLDEEKRIPFFGIGNCNRKSRACWKVRKGVKSRSLSSNISYNPSQSIVLMSAASFLSYIFSLLLSV